MTDWSFETKAIHVGQEADKETGAINVPIYQTSTYKQEGVGNYPFSDYARVDNPTRSALQMSLAALEGAKHGLAFASGLAAEDALLRTLSSGDHVIMDLDAYGGTYRLIDKILAPHGLTFSTVDLNDLKSVQDAWRPTTKMLWVETPTNPALKIVDIEALAAIAHENNGLLIVDNTFATPYLQQPFGLGADVVVHSTTKYVGGHSDVIGGFLALNDDELAEQLKFLQYAVGAVPGPFDCYILLRGIKTLPIRMDRHCENAFAVAEALQSHNAVEKVLFPGLIDHPNHDIAVKQMRDFGGMVSFIVKGGSEAAIKVAESTELFTLAESLGAVESLIDVPAAMTHTSVNDSPLEVNPALIRLSVGLESAQDLISDLTSALDKQIR
jgi:cystathionine gamma-synthase